MRRWRAAAIAALVFAAGCGGPPVRLVPVEGTVVFKTGSMPRAEIAKICFDPVTDDKQRIRKTASGDIGPDGRFALMTLRPGDGVIPGRYKVLFTIRKTYLGNDSLVPDRYASPDSTPFEVTVQPGSNPPFHFEIE